MNEYLTSVIVNGTIYDIKDAVARKNISEIKEAISDLNDKKITKFYANNLGETTLNDSDNGKIADMMIYGKSAQDGTPTPESPVEIQSVVNPTVNMCGKNLFNKNKTVQGYAISNGGCVANDAFSLTDYIAISGNKMYIRSKSGEQWTTYHSNNSQPIELYDEEKNKINVTSISSVINGYYTNLGEAKFVRTSFKTNELDTFEFMISFGDYETFEPYKEQTATLPYTLNAIPVSSGGNVTIDGQQYIADYVDVERKKLVRMTDLTTFNGSEKWVLQSINTYGIANFEYVSSKNHRHAICVCNMFPSQNSAISTTNNEGVLVNTAFQIYIRIKSDKCSTVDEFKNWLSTNNTIVLSALQTPTETDLTDEEVQAFKDFATYYPITNVSVTSEQLNGYTTFNYPISLASGWNYVKEQLGDTREYIYDMDLQSAEAYINSEYAVALAELEV